MEVTVVLRPVPGFPELQGPHELSWAYLLDAIFADAYHNQLQSLLLVLPSEALQAEVQLRAELTPPRKGATGHGLALLAGGEDEGLKGDRVYRLEFGRLAPASLKTQNGPVVVQAATRLSVFTWNARVLGVPIRLFQLARRPDWSDRTMFQMRRVFAAWQPTPAYYHLHLGVVR